MLDRLGDGCKVEFPVQLPILKLGKKCFIRDSDGILREKPRSFYETLCITLFKQRC